MNYNDVVRRVYDALFELNVECDFLPVDAPSERFAQYRMIITPALYSVPEMTIAHLRGFVESGGHLVSTLRSFVTDDEVTVWHDRAPHNLTDVFGLTYNQFTRPKGRVPVRFGSSAALAGVADTQAEALIELLKADADTEVLAYYGHYAWQEYAAVTRHGFAGAAPNGSALCLMPTPCVPCCARPWPTPVWRRRAWRSPVRSRCARA